MRRSIYLLLVSPIMLLSEPANALDEQRFHQLRQLMIDGCSLGMEMEIEVTGGGGLSIFRRGVSGEVSFSQRDLPTIISKIEEDVDRRALANDTRACMERFMNRLFDAVLAAEQQNETQDQDEKHELSKALQNDTSPSAKMFSLLDDETAFLLDGKHWFTFEHGRTANAGCIRVVLDGERYTHCVGKSLDIEDAGRSCGIIYLGSKDKGVTADFALRCQGA